jgi:hypothetical protein
MRSAGFVPRIDIEPDFTLEYDGKKYNFTLSLYGIYVGKVNSKKICGIDKNKPILYTRKNKSEKSFQPQA